MSLAAEKLSTDLKTFIAAFGELKASNVALSATVTDLTAEVAKLKAEAGTPDADLDALDALVVAANPPAAPAPEPTPDPVVTTDATAA